MVDRTSEIKEEWNEVKGYEGLYRVSNLGSVYSLLTKKTLKKPVNSSGYSLVVLSINGQKKSFNIHRLVATAFVPNPNNREQVNHKDGDKTNNDSRNLEWVTQSDNMKHAYRMRLQTPSISQKLAVADHCRQNYSKKVRQYDLNGVFVTEYPSASDAARNTGAFQSNISKVCRGQMSKTHNYKWEYAE